MKPNHTDRNVSTSGVAASQGFQISLEHSAHIMSILRDTLYSDKVLAVMREYAANAWDAHREVGKSDVPIHVTLPTVKDPTLYIKDFGPGLSHEDMFTIYSQYGASTKRNNDNSVGMLGIGSKSGFAYTDSFTITSRYGGKQRIYTALLDNDEKGTLNLLSESDAEDGDTGIEIQIPIRPIDIPEFVHKATNLFQFFRPRPVMNISLPAEREDYHSLQNGIVARGHGDWLAVMGCIPYRINLDQLRGLNAPNGGAGNHFNHLTGQLFFNIGDVQINASREELKYSDDTKAKLVNKLNDLIDEFVTQTLNQIEEGDFSFWDKRCRAQVLNDMRLPIPGILKLLTDERVPLPEAQTYTVTYGPKQTQVSSISVNVNSRILIRDEKKKIEGYGLNGFDYIVRPREDIDPKPTVDDVRKELEQIISDQKLTGIPVLNISTLPWHSKAKFKNVQLVKNEKHKVKTFVLKENKSYYSTPWADCWDIEKREPTDDDVFVILHKFKVYEEGATHLDTRFYSVYKRDAQTCEELGVKMPKVYGYKWTEKAPIKASQLKGKHYDAWRAEFFKNLPDHPKIKPYYDAYLWIKLITRSSNRYYVEEISRVPVDALRMLFQTLGATHPICVLFKNVMVGKKLSKRIKEEMRGAIRRLYDINSEDGMLETEPQKYLNKIFEEYPLLNVTHNNINELCGNDRDLWIEYVRLVDNSKGLNYGKQDPVHNDQRGDHGRLEEQTVHHQEGSSDIREPEASTPTGPGDGLPGGVGCAEGEDGGPTVTHEDGEAVVEQQVRDDGGLGDVYGAACA